MAKLFKMVRAPTNGARYEVFVTYMHGDADAYTTLTQWASSSDEVYAMHDEFLKVKKVADAWYNNSKLPSEEERDALENNAFYVLDVFNNDFPAVPGAFNVRRQSITYEVVDE